MVGDAGSDAAACRLFRPSYQDRRGRLGNLDDVRSALEVVSGRRHLAPPDSQELHRLRRHLHPNGAARAVQGFNPELKLGEDWEFWCRLAVLGDFVAMPDHVALLIPAALRQRELPAAGSAPAAEFRGHRSGVFQPRDPAKIHARGIRRKRRRLAEIDAFWAGARNEYVQRPGIRILSDT